MPRLLLVFWNIVFFEFETSFSIITFFFIIVIYDLQNNFFKTLRLCFIRSLIDSSSRSIRVKVFPFMFFLSKPLFKFLQSLFEGFCIAEKVYKLRFLGLWLRFFDFKVFYSNVLGLYFSCDNVNKTIILLDLVVYFLNIRSRLEAYFSLSFDRFFDDLF